MLMGTAAPTKKQLEQYSSKKNTAQKYNKTTTAIINGSGGFVFLFGNSGVLSAQIFFICFIDFMSLTTSRHRHLLPFTPPERCQQMGYPVPAFQPLFGRCNPLLAWPR